MNAITRVNAIARLSRRRVLQGMLGGTAVTVGLPFLDCFLDSNGVALAATGTALPVCFGTWYYGCGLNPGRWEPKTEGPNYEFGVELQPLTPFRHKLNVYSQMSALLDGRPPSAAMPQSGMSAIGNPGVNDSTQSCACSSFSRSA